LLENYIPLCIFLFWLLSFSARFLSLSLNGDFHKRACMEYERIGRQELCCFGCQSLTMLIEGDNVKSVACNAFKTQLSADSCIFLQ